MLLYNQLFETNKGVLMQLRKVTEEDLFSLIKLENEALRQMKQQHQNFETENQ